MHTLTLVFGRKISLRVTLLLMALFTTGVATAANQPAEDFQMDGRFLVEDVRLQGLQRVSAGTVFNLIPVTVGDALDSLAIRSTMRSLFRSGYFEDIQLARDGGVLIVTLVERPAIESIVLEGNKAMSRKPYLGGSQSKA